MFMFPYGAGIEFNFTSFGAFLLMLAKLFLFPG